MPSIYVSVDQFANKKLQLTQRGKIRQSARWSTAEPLFSQRERCELTF